MADIFGPFELDRLLGRGGMAEVFIARRVDEERHQPLVLKRIRPDLAGDSEYLRRFVLEAQVASRLSHANLVRFVEFGRVGDCHYIAMEHVDGHSLHRLLEPVTRKHEPPPIEVALHIAHGILSALSAMHGVTDDDGRTRPMLHRDVTPANVIITKDGRPVLIDFGITKDVLGPAITLPGKVIGTARYMAPEHRKAEFIDPRADVFSASVILWELLTAHHPWSPLETIKEILRVTFDPPEIPAAVKERVPQDVEAVVQRGLLCDPPKRFESAGAMREALSACEAFKAIGDRGESMTQSWIGTLGLRPDGDLGAPVVDHGLGQELMWSANGKIATDELSAMPVHEPNAPDIAVLNVPPLPPPRAASLVEDDEASVVKQALGRPMWVTALVVSVILAGLIGAAILFLARH